MLIENAFDIELGPRDRAKNGCASHRESESESEREVRKTICPLSNCIVGQVLESALVASAASEQRKSE